MPRATGNSKKTAWVDSITDQTFNGLNINSTGSEPCIRNATPPPGNGYQADQKMKRETLGKAQNDMERKVLKLLTKALENPIRLPFYVSDFEEQRKNGIPIHNSPVFRELRNHPTRLTMKDGAAVVTDLADIPVLWYFPHFIGTGLQINLMTKVDALAEVYRPPPDAEIRDRRTGDQQSRPVERAGPGPRYMTRSQTAIAESHLVNQSSFEHEDDEKQENVSPVTMEEPTPASDGEPSPEAYKEAVGEVRLEEQLPTRRVILPEGKSLPKDSRTRLAEYVPFAYYWSPGWCPTGMQRLGRIAMSVHFRNALSQGLKETIELLEAKRLLDGQIALLTEIIQPSLSKSLKELKAHMSAVQGPTGTAVVNGWTSDFPCYGVAVNRVTGMHRDSKGIRAGLDVIGVIGTFNEGGDLEFPDLNLCLEWLPGCLGAFDGYDFRHGVRNWRGGSRIALISFCRQSTWSALGLNPNLTRPTLSDCREQLLLARERRAARQEAHAKGAALAAETDKPGPTRQNSLVRPRENMQKCDDGELSSTALACDGGVHRAKKSKVVAGLAGLQRTG